LAVREKTEQIIVRRGSISTSKKILGPHQCLPLYGNCFELLKFPLKTLQFSSDNIFTISFQLKGYFSSIKDMMDLIEPP
jgi:hypothetical protein